VGCTAVLVPGVLDSHRLVGRVQIVDASRGPTLFTAPFAMIVLFTTVTGPVWQHTCVTLLPRTCCAIPSLQLHRHQALPIHLVTPQRPLRQCVAQVPQPL
jgi:hypothetical protein